MENQECKQLFANGNRNKGGSSESTGRMVKDALALVRKVHVAILIYNDSTAAVIFAHKLLCLSGGIVGLYFLLRLILLQPVVSMLFFVLAYDSITFYSVMWDNASLIQFMIRELKDELGVLTAASGVVSHRQYWRRISRSVPCVGVSVGGFRSMERDSTLIFMDFVLKNLVSLLVSD